MSRNSRCNVSNEMIRNVKLVSRHFLNQILKKKCISCAEKYIKTDIKKVLFTDEARVTLDGPDK